MVVAVTAWRTVTDKLLHYAACGHQLLYALGPHGPAVAGVADSSAAAEEVQHLAHPLPAHNVILQRLHGLPRYSPGNWVGFKPFSSSLQNNRPNRRSWRRVGSPIAVQVA